MRRKLADVILLPVVLGLFAAGNVWLVKRGAQEVAGLEVEPNASSFNGGPSGLRGLYFFWRELGYDVRVWRKGFRELPREAGMLVVAAPFPYSEGIAKVEEKHLSAWVKAGHQVLVAGAGDALESLLGAELSLGGAGRGEVLPTAPSGVMTGVRSLSASYDRWGRMRGAAVVHAGDRKGALVLARRVGKGEAVGLADGSLVSNGHLAEGDNVIFAANLASLAHGPIYFDEYHHGFRERVTVLGLLWRPRWRWMTLQTLLALALLVHAASRRFGHVVPLQAGRRYRASVEYVAALAGLYQRAQAREMVLARVGQSFRREVARALGLPPSVSAERLAEVAQRRSGVERERLLRALSLCDRAGAADLPARWQAEPRSALEVAPGSRPKEGSLLWVGQELETLRRQALRIER